MAYKVARTLLFSLLAVLSAGALTGTVPPAGGCLWAGPRPQGERAVYVAGDLSDESLITLTAGLAAADPDAVVLLDTPPSSEHNKVFLANYRPGRVVPVGPFRHGIADLELRLGVRLAPAVACGNEPPAALWQSLFPRVERVVVCPEKPRGLVLQAACLAGVVKAPLYVVRDRPESAAALRRRLAEWRPQTIFAAGSAVSLCRHLPDSQVVALRDEQATAAAYLRRQLENGPVRNLVVANPADVEFGFDPVSPLAPWVTLQKRGYLLLTNERGSNVGELVNAALRHRSLLRADALILVADLESIPMEQRPNPIPQGKDPTIEMEPLTPTGATPFSFATGRLFHEDPAVVALLLARQRLVQDAGPVRKALVISNPAGGLPLLEAFSRNTAKELRNGGLETTAMFGEEVNKDALRRLLPEQQIFLWEGHYSTFAREYKVPDWPEPLQPSLIFLQSCLALNEEKAQPLLERGGLGIIGSSTRTYSASGGACALAFFNALLYENQSVGGSLRRAKNFLLAYSLLKEKRLGKDARLLGANVRSAWAFSLWGDPTLKLTLPDKPADALPPVRHEVHGNTVVVRLPDAAHDKVKTSKYGTEMWPNGSLAGLVTKALDDDVHRLVPFVFAEVHLPKAPRGKQPQVQSRLPSSRYVFCWDERRRCGYLLAAPRSKDREELRFHIHWVADAEKATTVASEATP